MLVEFLLRKSFEFYGYNKDTNKKDWLPIQGEKMLKIALIYTLSFVALVILYRIGNMYLSGSLKMKLGKQGGKSLFAGAPGISLHGFEISDELRRYLGKIVIKHPTTRRRTGRA
jgi:hypothetical protein